MSDTRTGLTIGFLVLGLAGSAATAETPRPTPTVEAAIRSSLAFLERDGFAWMAGEHPIQAGSGCVSCHHVTFALWTAHEAAERGMALPGSRIDALAERAIEFQSRRANDQVVPAGQFLLARASTSQREVRDETAPIWVDKIDASQEACGNWEARGQFPTQRRPIEETDAVATHWTLLALASTDADDPPTREARERALGWARDNVTGESVEWLATRMLVERSLLEPARADALRARLLAAQNRDGGWPWAPGEPSNAFSTGQALWALAGDGPNGPQAASPETRRALAAAVDWLLERQQPDGTWSTSSALVSTAPSPGKDYVYTYWGTAWATLGLLRRASASPDQRSGAS